MITLIFVSILALFSRSHSQELVSGFDDLPLELKEQIISKCHLSTLAELSRTSKETLNLVRNDYRYEQHLVQKCKNCFGSLEASLVIMARIGTPYVLNVLMSHGANPKWRHHDALVSAALMSNKENFNTIYNHPSSHPIPSWDCRFKKYLENGDISMMLASGSPTEVVEAAKANDFEKVDCLIRTLESPTGLRVDFRIYWDLVIQLAINGRMDLLKLLESENFQLYVADIQDLRHPIFHKRPDILYKILAMSSNEVIHYLAINSGPNDMHISQTIYQFSLAYHTRWLTLSLALQLARNGRIDALKIYLDEGITSSDLLAEAARGGSLETVLLILSYNPDIPVGLLSDVAKLSQIEIWIELVSRGATMDMLDLAMFYISESPELSSYPTEFWQNLLTNPKTIVFLSKMENPGCSAYFAIRNNLRNQSFFFLAGSTDWSPIGVQLIDMAIMSGSTKVAQYLANLGIEASCQSIIDTNPAFSFDITAISIELGAASLDSVLRCLLNSPLIPELYPRLELLNALLMRGYLLNDISGSLSSTFMQKSIFSSLFFSHKVIRPLEYREIFHQLLLESSALETSDLAFILHCLHSRGIFNDPYFKRAARSEPRIYGLLKQLKMA